MSLDGRVHGASPRRIPTLVMPPFGDSYQNFFEEVSNAARARPALAGRAGPGHRSPPQYRAHPAEAATAKETEVSFWYIANKLGPRLLGVAERRLGRLESGGPGVWRSSVLGYPCVFVSTVDLPVDEDSFPLHVLGIEPRERNASLASSSRRIRAGSMLTVACFPHCTQRFGRK